MEFTTEQPNPCTLEVSVNVTAEQVARAFESVYREFSRYVSVPGFRPGKAPRALMEKYVNQARLQERVKEKIVTEQGEEALKEAGAEPYRAPSLEAGDVQDKQPFSFKITVPLEPIVNLGAYTGITVDRPSFPITEEMTDARIDRIRNDRARIERVADRAVEAEDVLIAEISIEADGETISPKRRQLLNLATSSKQVVENVLGLNIDEERTFDVAYGEEDAPQEELVNKTATYTVKLASISAKKLPDMDDAFAQQLGFETLEEFRNDMKAQLEAEGRRYADQVAEQSIIQNILENSEIHYPYALVREEMEDAYRQLAAELKRINVSYEIWLQANGYTIESHREEVENVANLRVRTILALHKIAQQENFSVNDEAIDAEFNNLLQQGRITEEQLDEWIEDNRRRFQIANALIQQDLHKFLFENNTLNEVVLPEAPSPEEIEEAVADAE